MNLLALGIRVVPQQRLRVFPTRQSPDFANTRLVDHVEKRSAAAFAVDRTFDMRRLDFASMHLDLSVFADERLGQVKGVVVVFGVSKHHRDVIVCCRRANRLHLWTVSFQGMLHVFSNHLEVDWTLPDRHK